MEKETMNEEQDIYDYYFFLPDKVLMIKRKFRIKDTDCYMVAMTERMDQMTLWILFEHELPKKGRFAIHDDSMTNREHMESLEGIYFRDSINEVNEIRFGDQIFKSGGSSSGALMENQGDGFAKVQYFIDQGLSLDDLRPMSLPDVYLLGMDLYREASFDMEKADFRGEITMITNKVSRSVDIKKALKLPFGMYDKPITVDFACPETNSRHQCHINGMITYDIWADRDVDRLKGKAKEYGMSEKEFIETMAESDRMLEDFCPRDKGLVMVAYETDENASAMFYTERWLSDTIGNSQGSGGIGVIMGGDDTPGLMGGKVRYCQLDVVDKDFEEEMEVELYSWTETLPEETYVI